MGEGAIGKKTRIKSNRDESEFERKRKDKTR
jgi:hypothetical protein